MSLEDEFNSAVDRLPLKIKNISQEDQLFFYARYKVAKIGPCNTEKPPFYKPKDVAKWNAWKEQSELSQQMAMQEYIMKYEMLFPDEDLSLPTYPLAK